jgi:hypothetical protein
LPAHAAPRQTKGVRPAASMATTQNSSIQQVDRKKAPDGRKQYHAAAEGSGDNATSSNSSPYISGLSDINKSLSQPRSSRRQSPTEQEPSVRDLMQESMSQQRKHSRKEMNEYDAAQARQQVSTQLEEIDARRSTVVDHIIAVKVQMIDSWSAENQALLDGIASAVSDAISNVQGSTSSAREQTQSSLGAERDEIEQSKQGSLAEVTDSASQKIESISTTVQTQAALLREAGGEASSAGESLGSSESQRVDDQVSQQKDQVNRSGMQAAQGIHDEDPDLADAKRDAVTETVEKVSDQIQEGVEPMQELAKERSGELSRALGGVGSQAADELIAGIEPVSAGFDDQAAQTSDVIDQYADLAVDQLVQVGNQSLHGVETIRISSIEQLQVLPQLVGPQCESALLEAEAQVNSQVTQITAGIDNDVASLQGALSSLERPDPDAVRVWINSALQGLTSSENEAIEQLGTIAQNGHNSLSEQTVKAQEQIMELSKNVEGELVHLSQASIDAAAQPTASVTEGIATIATSFTQNVESTATTAETEVVEGVGKTVEGVEGTSNDTRGAVAQKIDDGLKTNAQLVEGLPSAITSAISTAEEQYNESWWETGLRWAGSALAWVGEKIVAIGKALWEMAHDPGFWVGLAIGVGLAILAAGTIASGGLLAVAVAGAIGATAAAAGTIVSNVTHNRPWHENLIRNIFIGAAAGAGAVAGPLILGSMSHFAASLVGLEVAAGASTVIANVAQGKPWHYQLIESMAILAIFHVAGTGITKGASSLRGGMEANPNPTMGETTPGESVPVEAEAPASSSAVEVEPAPEGTEPASEGELGQAREATGFKGRKGFELKNEEYQPLRNEDAVIENREYSGHSLDDMQNRGIMPSVVENTIQNGIPSPDPIPGRMRFYDPENNVSVVTEGGRVVSVRFGGFGGEAGPAAIEPPAPGGPNSAEAEIAPSSASSTEVEPAPEGTEPANQVRNALGEKASETIRNAFGDITEFNELVGNIKSNSRPTLETVESIRSYFEEMGYAEAPENQVMLDRLEAIARGDLTPESVDIDFMQHELLERALVERGVPKGYEDVQGSSQVWDPAHDITRIALGVDDVYHQTALEAEHAPAPPQGRTSAAGGEAEPVSQAEVADPETFGNQLGVSLKGKPGSFFVIAERINSAGMSQESATIAAESATRAMGLRLVRVPMSDGNVVISSVMAGSGNVLIVDPSGRVAYASATITVRGPMDPPNPLTVDPQNPMIIENIEPR